jgi:competence protein ComEC
MLLGALAAATAPRPDLLITGDGRHVAVIDEAGVPHLLRARAGDYVRSLVSESAGFDGDGLELERLAEADCSRDSCVAEVRGQGRSWALLATRSTQTLDWAELVAGCAAADIVVSERRLPRGCVPRWLKLDRVALARSGGLAIHLDAKPRVDSVAERVRSHPWAQTAPAFPAARRRARTGQAQRRGN